jgi:hypothetical protein
MAQYNVANFKTLYGSSGTVFPDNTTGEISEGDMRQFGEDIADSFGNLLTSPPIRYGGTWAFPAGAFPVAANAGTLYITTAAKGAIGDADYVPSGAWLISTINGASSFSDYSYKL